MPRIPSDAVQGAGTWVDLRPLTWGETKVSVHEADVEPLIMARVTAWNWADSDGSPLPLPHTPEVVDALTVDEIRWLALAIIGNVKDERAKADALLASLWTGSTKAQPSEYAEYVLCAKVYHCTPSELDRQDAAKVRLHLGFWNAEQKHRQAERKAAAGLKGKK